MRHTQNVVATVLSAACRMVISAVCVALVVVVVVLPYILIPLSAQQEVVAREGRAPRAQHTFVPENLHRFQVW